MDYEKYTYEKYTSIKTKNRLHKKYFKNKNDNTDNFKREFYRKYLNKLTHIKI